MIRIENISVVNLDNAIRGMRNPLESWSQSDSYWHTSSCEETYEDEYIIGDKDKELALKLIKAGSDHSKFMRQIFVSMDITAPRYWWTEMDTYKISTVANSCSTMHTLYKTPITPKLFSLDCPLDEFEEYCEAMENIRQLYLETNQKYYWRMLIQMLPQSFNQMRTWTGNYQNLRNIYHARLNHKISEWREFCKVIEELPYSELIVGEK